jgi:hypothetical protein
MSATLFHKAIQTIEHPETKFVMEKVHALYCMTRIVNDLGTFRDNDFISTEQSKLMKKATIETCTFLKDHAIKISDAFGPSEKAIQSALAMNDGKVYHNFLDRVYAAEGCFDKPDWAEHVLDHDKMVDLVEKLN